MTWRPSGARVHYEGRGLRPGLRDINRVRLQMGIRRPLTIVAFCLAIGSGGVIGLPASNVRASTSSDIPGTPLPSPVVTGQLGGPIYDVVYSIQVPPAHVVVAGLRGDQGTDFDLYLFDASATTVVNNIGVVAKSTGSTSTESISFPTRLGGTFYIDLNGASPAEGAYVLSVQIVPDSTPPVVTQVLLDGGSPSTNDSTVSILIAATDDLSGVPYVALSGDGQAFGPWLPYSGSFAWTFPPGDGKKQFWVKAQNGIGLESSPVMASIVVDTVPPSVVGVNPAPDAITTLARPPIRVTFSEPINSASWEALGLTVQNADGSIVSGSLTYDPVTMSGVFTPTSDLVPGQVYFAAVGAVRDVAGNSVVAMGSWALKAMAPTGISLRTSLSSVTYGSSVTLTGTASIPNGAAVTLLSRPGTSTLFSLNAQLIPAPTFSTTVVPQATTTYRVDYGGSTSAVPSSSPERTVVVRWAVAIMGPGPVVARSSRAGSSVTIQARLLPAIAGSHVSFQLYRYDAVRRTYVYAGSRGARTQVTGLASISWRPTVGTWHWRLLALAGPGYSAATSSAYTWKVGP